MFQGCRLRVTGYRILVTGCWLLVGFLGGAFSGYAGLKGQQLEPHQAAIIAQNWVRAESPNFKTALLIREVALHEGLYLVSFDPSGFAIVPAARQEIPVWAYSTESTIPDDPDHPFNLLVLPHFRASIEDLTLKPQNSYSKVPVKPETANFKHKTDLSVDPILTAHWGQGIPWNKFCPADDSGRHALVGCVAVAMSQIMYHWEWPPRGYGSNSYTPLAHPQYGVVSADFDTLYGWADMDPVIPSDASALLLFHTGVASFMNYGPDESGSNTSFFAMEALEKNFFYHTGLLFREMEEFTWQQWTRMLRQELANNRPILYNGTNPVTKAGHAFNIDGYRDNDFFHFNWGWNGAGNGWFMLWGMGGGGSDFSLHQGALFGFQPANQPLHDRPSSLLALSGDDFAELMWDSPSVSDLSHYTVYRNGEQIALTSSTRFRDEDQANGTTNRYTVTASYTGQHPGESLPTPEALVSPWPRIIPEYHQDFESGAQGWLAASDPSGFRIVAASDVNLGSNSSHVAFIRSDLTGDGVRISDYLISPVIYPGDHANLAISFRYLFRQRVETDYLYLMYRRFDDGLWNLVSRLDSTGGWNDWKDFYIYIPEEAGRGPVQLAFYYDNHYGSGFGAAIDDIRIFEVPDPPVPGFSAESNDICQQHPVTFTSHSTGNITNWFWDFGSDAEPRYADNEGPHQVVFAGPGKKDIRLSLNHLDHLIQKEVLTVRPKPVSGFNWSRSSMTIQFTSTASNAESLWWDFGDGTYGTGADPQHIYFTKELFNVIQVAFNGTCHPDTTLTELDLRPGTGIGDQSYPDGFVIFPNPAHDYLVISCLSEIHDPASLRLMAPDGRMILQEQWPDRQDFTLNLQGIPAGLYILQIQSEKNRYLHKLIIERP